MKTVLERMTRFGRAEDFEELRVHLETEGGEKKRSTKSGLQPGEALAAAFQKIEPIRNFKYPLSSATAEIIDALADRLALALHSAGRQRRNDRDTADIPSPKNSPGLIPR